MKKEFLFGALGYPAMELAFRGRTHYSMALAGGAAVCLISELRKTRLPVSVKAGLCGVGITAVEYLCGCIWNRQYKVWDYRNVPLNFHGQICVPYSLLWCGLSAGFMLVQRTINAKTGQS